MLLINPLERILGQASKVRILKFLVASGLELNGREVASAVGLSHVKAHTALKELNQYGVVTMRHSGKSILYQINMKNIVVNKILIPLFEKEKGLGDMLAGIIMKYINKPAPKSVILFGSFASNHARPDSDIDLLIIVPKKEDMPIFEEGLKKAEINITVDFGNHLAPVLMDEEEFKTKFKKREKFVMNIVRDGKVLSGASINELIQAP